MRLFSLLACIGRDRCRGIRLGLGVDRGALVGNFSHIAVVAVSLVVDMLDTTVGESNGIGVSVGRDLVRVDLGGCIRGGIVGGNHRGVVGWCSMVSWCSMVGWGSVVLGSGDSQSSRETGELLHIVGIYDRTPHV